jgi:hypothetical protein
MNNWCVFLFFTHIFTGNFNFKGLSAREENVTFKTVLK